MRYVWIVVRMAGLLVAAYIVTKLLRPLGLEYAWGVSQNLTASALLLAMELVEVGRLEKAQRLVAHLSETIRTTLTYDLAKIDEDAFRVVALGHDDLKTRVVRLLTDAAKVRSRLSRALGRIEGAMPETIDEIENGGR